MKISRTKFVILFLVSAFTFRFITNSILGPEVRFFPGGNGASFLGAGIPIAWKHMIATILSPAKIILIGPLSPLFELPDPPPPLLAIPFAFYWTVLALGLYYFFSKIRTRKKS